jgi:S1/P1 Nuclease
MAWNAEGHMAVAQLAYNHLDPTVKARCDVLIAVPLSPGGTTTNTFVTAACWADDFKSQLGTGNWHYIDLPFSLDGTSFANFIPEPFDLVKAVNQCIATLQNPTATQTAHAMSLRYLIHLIGDIQQPLHCSDAFFAAQPNGDAGGNGFNLTGTWSNLHSLWDAGGGYLTDSLPRPLSAASQATLNNRVATIEAAAPYLRSTTGTIPDPMSWALEAKALAVSICYAGITRGTAPSSAYLQTARSTTEARMALGGKRLADLLNTIFAVKPTTFRAPNGDFGFSWSAVPGTVYHLEWADHPALPDWTPLTDITATGSTAAFQEPAAHARRFYRLRR